MFFCIEKQDVFFHRTKDVQALSIKILTLVLTSGNRYSTIPLCFLKYICYLISINTAAPCKFTFEIEKYKCKGKCTPPQRKSETGVCKQPVC